jgi:RHS repeat-associated protein
MKRILLCFGFLMTVLWGNATTSVEHETMADIEIIVPYWYHDKDGDGFGASVIDEAPIKSSVQPTGYVSNSSDIDDENANITNIPPQTFYRDFDLDTFGNASITVYYSVKPAGYVNNSSDCNDADASLNPNTVWYRDVDGDGYGTSTTTLAQCTQPAGYVRNASDYNDGTANITNIAPQTFYQDGDGDTFGNPSVSLYYSVKPVGYVTNSTDCNDSDASLTPNSIWYRDADEDGFGLYLVKIVRCTQPNGFVRNGEDYDDTTSNINNIPPQTFYSDADGDTFGTATITIYYSVKPTGYVANSTDCNDADATVNPNTVWYRDADGDGYGISTITLAQCAQPAGYVRNTSDYNDSTVNITNIAPQTFYRDADGDTFGSSSLTVYYSARPVGYVANNTDCNDADATLNPNTVWYRDADGDGYGISANTLTQCVQPVGYVRNSSDYNDSTVNITNIAPQTFYQDADTDTFGNPSVSLYYSVKPAGYVANSTDCNDVDATLNPNTVWYRDADGDGYGVASSTLVQCIQPVGYVRNSSDYNDTTVNITNIAPQTFYRDADADTFGSSTVTIYYSVKPAGYVSNSKDCNDADATLNPNTVWYRDADGDGYGVSTPAIIQCTQTLGYVRNSSDYNDSTVNIINIAPQTFYEDADGDTFGNAAVSKYYSVQPIGYVTNSSDYNDTTVNIINIAPQTFYEDTDNDTYGNPSVSKYYSIKPYGYVTNNTDYNDSTANITNIAPQYFYQDSDSDTFGNAAASLYYSIKPVGYVINNMDCDDINTTINPNSKWYPDTDGDGLGDPSSFLQQCVKPAGNYVLDNSDHCPLISGSDTDCSNVKAPSLDQNYIITTIYKQPTTTVFVNPDPNKAQVNITYFDGLGRPMQQIANQQSATGKDIVTNVEYDDFGRQTKDYLPFASTASNMAYDQNALTNTLLYYQKAIYDNTANPFSEKKLESSPLDRVLKQAAPGSDWAMDGGHEIKLDYQTNTETEVKLYNATTTWNPGLGLYDISFSDAGNYRVNQLYKTITYDENSTANPTDEKSGSTVEFKNKEGQVVLKRTYESGTKHDTYYVYDSYGNLTYVLPPMFTNAEDDLDGLCYQYKYDYRNRLVEKKLPGKQWEFIVYDKLDRPVATGPASSPFKEDTAVGWLVTKYDAFGRPVYTGWLNSAPSSAVRKSLQDTQNNATILFEKKQTSRVIDGIQAFYTNDIEPKSIKLLSVNYYDNYEFPNAFPTPTAVEGQTVLANTKTLATGSWTRVITTSSAILGETATIFYDAKARPICNAVTNYLGGYTNTESKLDAFSGQLQYTITKHKRTDADTELVIKEAFTYSPQDRLLTHTHQINEGAIQLLADNTYDELGQLTSKKVGNTSGMPLQKVDYTYNIRGWMTGINNDPTNSLVLNTAEKDLFGFKINYNTIAGTVADVKPLYNGNIAETYWRTDASLRKYGYVYDNLNRLKSAVYQKPNDAIPVSGAYNESLSYDKNGNIMSLQRFGTSDAPSVVFQIDDLGYEYSTANGNQLTKVTDGPKGNNGEGFIDGNKTGDDYTYDANGNLITDKNKNITAIVYNHLNLPTKITFGTTGTIEYIYNAVGQKLEKIVTDATTVTSTNYLGGFQYTKLNLGTWALQFFPTAEGYVKNTVVNSANNYSYVFNYTDHLGNVRLSYSDADKDGSIATTEIVEESHYYPFGLKHVGYVTSLGTDYKYKYNGKELQDELGLNMYAYGWRDYDPAIGRWNVIDQLSEKYYKISPYAYVANNPITTIDPDGRFLFGLFGSTSAERRMARATEFADKVGGTISMTSKGRPMVSYGGKSADGEGVTVKTEKRFGDFSSLRNLGDTFARLDRAINNGGHSDPVGYSHADAVSFSASLGLNSKVGSIKGSIGVAWTRNDIAVTIGRSMEAGSNDGKTGVASGFQFATHNTFGGATDVLKEMKGNEVGTSLSIGIGGGSSQSADKNFEPLESGVSTQSYNIGFGLGAGATTGTTTGVYKFSDFVNMLSN